MMAPSIMGRNRAVRNCSAAVVCCLLLSSVVFSCSADDRRVVAVIGDEEITSSEIDKAIEMQVYDHLIAINELRREAAENYIAERLLDKEAEKRGISRDSLVRSHSKYHKMVGFVGHFMKAENLEEQVGIMSRGVLRYVPSSSSEGKAEIGRRADTALRGMLVDSLKEAYGVRLWISEVVSPKTDISRASSQRRGCIGSKVVVDILSDYDCSVCRMMHKGYEMLFEEFGDKVEFRSIDLAGYVTPSAQGAMAASRQDSYWPMHDALMSTRNSVDSAEVMRVAIDMGLDMDQFVADYEDAETLEGLEESLEYLYGKGLYSTPTVMINGHRLRSATDLDLVRQEITRAINEIKK